jgi:hypothetical protein
MSHLGDYAKSAKNVRFGSSPCKNAEVEVGGDWQR